MFYIISVIIIKSYRSEINCCQEPLQIRRFMLSGMFYRVDWSIVNTFRKTTMPSHSVSSSRTFLNCLTFKAAQVWEHESLNTLTFLKPTGHVMHQQFNIQQLYVLPTLYLCVLYLSENKQRLVPLTAYTNWFLQPRWKVFTARYELSL